MCKPYRCLGALRPRSVLIRTWSVHWVSAGASARTGEGHEVGSHYESMLGTDGWHGVRDEEPEPLSQTP